MAENKNKVKNQSKNQTDNKTKTTGKDCPGRDCSGKNECPGRDRATNEKDKTRLYDF